MCGAKEKGADSTALLTRGDTEGAFKMSTGEPWGRGVAVARAEAGCTVDSGACRTGMPYAFGDGAVEHMTRTYGAEVVVTSRFATHGLTNHT